MFAKETSQKLRPINLVPLINVVFLLLTFFLVAGSIAPHTPLSISFPEATSPNSPSPESLRVTINKEGTIAFGDQITTLEALPNLLAEKLASDPNQPVLIQADKDLSASKLSEIVGLFEAVGVHNIKLITMGMR